MTRRNVCMLFLPLVLVAAAVFAPLTAAAQDADSDLPVYPGPFDTEQTDTAQTDTAETDTAESGDGTTVPDEVLGQTLVRELVQAEGYTAAARTADDGGEDNGARFVVPDIQPNPNASPAGAVSTAAPGLANTGSEVEPIIAMSVGLLAVGGSILVGSRRRLRDFFN